MKAQTVWPSGNAVELTIDRCILPFHDLAHSKSRAIREKPDFLKYRETASFLARAQRNPSGLKSNNPTAIASELVEVVVERQGGLS